MSIIASVRKIWIFWRKHLFCPCGLAAEGLTSLSSQRTMGKVRYGTDGPDGPNGYLPISLSAALTNNMYGCKRRALPKCFERRSLKLLSKIIITTGKMQQEGPGDVKGRGERWNLRKVIEQHCREYDASQLAFQRNELIRFARSLVRYS